VEQKIMKMKLAVISSLFLGLMLSGCQTTATTTYYLGAKADSKEAIYLSSGQEQQQRWQDIYVAIDYSYTRQGNQFNITGIFSFSDSAKINYQSVRRLKVKLFLLDKNMRVVDYREILQVLGYSLEDQDKINAKFVLDKNIVAFTFGYDGVLRGDEGFSNTIWKFPKRNP
jgi:hypothetical protein